MKNKKVRAGKSICSAYHHVGHIKTNKKCPSYVHQRNLPIQNISSTEIVRNEPILPPGRIDEDGNAINAPENEEITDSDTSDLDDENSADLAAELMNNPVLPPENDEEWMEIEPSDIDKGEIRSRSVSVDYLFPHTRRYLQKSRNIPDDTVTPGQFLDLLFNAKVLDCFVANTNSYAAHQEKPSWTNENSVTTIEIKKYFGIMLYMGLVQCSDQRNYWNQEELYRDSFVPKVM